MNFQTLDDINEITNDNYNNNKQKIKNKNKNKG